MYKCEFAREEVDYKLFFLRLLKKIWIIPLGIVIGSLLVGGLYCGYHFVIGEGRVYEATTAYYITYDTDVDGVEKEYYNYFTWEQYSDTDLFIDPVAEAMQGEMTKQEVIDNTAATIESDHRYAFTHSTSADKAQAIALEAAMSRQMLNVPEMNVDIVSVEIISVPTLDNLEDVSLIFVDHAFIIGAILGFFGSLVWALISFGMDSAVHIPASLERRYAKPCIGAASMEEFAYNAGTILGGVSKLAIVSPDDEEVAKKASELLNAELEEAAEKKPADSSVTSEVKHVFDKMVCKNPAISPESADVIRGCDGVLVAVKAGCKNSRKLQRMLEQLARQDIEVTAFMLVGEDVKLIKKYYSDHK